MVWIFLWIVVVVIVIGVMIWNLSLLIKQKKAMRIYAKKNELQYIPNGFSQAATVQGHMMGRRILITPEVVSSGDLRGNRQLTLIQLIFDAHMPVGGALGTGYFKEFVRNLNIVNLELFSKHNFNEDGLAATKNKDVMLDYYTPERIEVIKEVMALPHVDVLYIFDENEAVFQVFTVDPLETPKQIDVFVKTMLKAAKILEVSQGGNQKIEKNRVEEKVIEEDAPEDESSADFEA